MQRFIPFEYLDVEQAREKLDELLARAFAVVQEDGITEDRVIAIGSEDDPFIAWLTVDQKPVFRASLVPAPTEDGEGFAIHAYGSWLPNYREFLGEPKLEIVNSFVEKDATDPLEDEWSEPTNPESLVN